MTLFLCKLNYLSLNNSMLSGEGALKYANEKGLQNIVDQIDEARFKKYHRKLEKEKSYICSDTIGAILIVIENEIP